MNPGTPGFPDFTNRPQRVLAGAENADLGAGTGTITWLVPVAGARYFRVRAKASIQITVTVTPLRGDQKTKYTKGASSVTIAGGSDDLLDVTLGGEGWVQVDLTYAVTGGAVLNYLDVMEL